MANLLSSLVSLLFVLLPPKLSSFVLPATLVLLLYLCTSSGFLLLSLFVNLFFIILLLL